MFLTVNTELLTMLMMSLARDADALGSIKVEEEVEAIILLSLYPIQTLIISVCKYIRLIILKFRLEDAQSICLLCTV